MRRLPTLLLAFVVGCRSAPTSTAEDILKRAQLAVQPADVPPPHTIVMEGTSEYRGRTGLLGIGPTYQHRRESGVFYQELKAPFGVMQRWFDGRRGWASRPEIPYRTLPDAELSEVRREAALFQPWAIRDEYATLAYEGRRREGEREYDVIGGRSRFGKTERFWFDAVTGLVRYLDVWEEGPEGQRIPGGGEFYRTRYVVEDYRPVGRLMLPFRVQRIRPSSAMDARFTTIRIDVAVDTVRERPLRGQPSGADR